MKTYPLNSRYFKPTVNSTYLCIYHEHLLKFTISNVCIKMSHTKKKAKTKERNQYNTSCFLLNFLLLFGRLVILYFIISNWCEYESIWLKLRNHVNQWSHCTYGQKFIQRSLLHFFNGIFNISFDTFLLMPLTILKRNDTTKSIKYNTQQL